MRILEVALSGTVGTVQMGPVSTVICELSNRFAARGHDVILADVASTAPRDLLRPGIRLVQIRGKPQSSVDPTLGRARALTRRWQNYYQCMHQLKASSALAAADIVHLHSPIPAFLLQRLYGMRTVYTAHTPLWSLRESREGGKDSLGARLHAWVERGTIRKSQLTVALGDYLKTAVPDAEIVTIANGLNVDAWMPTDRKSARQALDIGDLDFVVLFTGRMTHVKGVDVLLQAVRLLAHDLPNLKAFVVGPLSGSFDTRDEQINPYARSVMEAARDLPVSFTGFINNRDVRFKQFFAAADVFVVPSRREPQGLVVLESMAMGTPVIGSATGGISDMVSPDVGYLFKPEDASGLAACIRDAYDNPDRLRQLRLAARSRVEARYSWEGVADRYLTEFARRVPTQRC